MAGGKFKTKVFIEEYKGQPIFAIHKVDEKGRKLEKFSQVISFGKAKAEAVYEHRKELVAFMKGELTNDDTEESDDE